MAIYVKENPDRTFKKLLEDSIIIKVIIDRKFILKYS